MTRDHDPLTWRAPRTLDEAFGPYHDQSPVLCSFTRRPRWLVIVDALAWVAGVALFVAVIVAAFIVEG